MTVYRINRADNGWTVEWLDDVEEPVNHQVLFQIPDDTDENVEDPQALVDLLYFVKEQVCGQFYSKHKRRNVVISMEDMAG